MDARRPGAPIPTIAAVFLAAMILAAGSACGRKDGGAPAGADSGREAPVPAVPAGSAAAEPSSPSPMGEGDVRIEPLSPCRDMPPAISVRPASGGTRKVVSVQWIVNGRETEKGIRLSRSAFRHGDRIQAVVVLVDGGEERVVTTREVTASNSLPAVTSVRLDPAAPVTGGTLRAVVEASDADHDPLKIRFQWFVDDAAVPGESETLVLKGVKRGSTVYVKATPNDGSSDGAWMESERRNVVNGPPVVKSEVPREIPADGRFLYAIVAEDPDGDPLSYAFKEGPPGMELKGNTLEWQVPDSYLGREVRAVVEISDGQGSRTVQTLMFAVQPPR